MPIKQVDSMRGWPDLGLRNSTTGRHEACNISSPCLPHSHFKPNHSRPKLWNKNKAENEVAGQCFLLLCETGSSHTAESKPYYNGLQRNSLQAPTVKSAGLACSILWELGLAQQQEALSGSPWCHLNDCKSYRGQQAPQGPGSATQYSPAFCMCRGL